MAATESYKCANLHNITGVSFQGSMSNYEVCRLSGKDDALQIAEVPVGMAKWRVNTHFSGVGGHGMSDIVNAWQPGSPWNLL